MTNTNRLDPDGIPCCDGPHPSPRKPALKAPPGAVDCHAHIFGPVARYPFSPKRLFTPPDTTVEQYRGVLATLGIARAVLVTPSVYGMDNERQLDALAATRGEWRGVAVVPTDVSDAELDRLHRAGFRGVRVNLFAKSGLLLEDLEAIAARVSAFRWHVQLHADARELEPLAPRRPSVSSGGPTGRIPRCRAACRRTSSCPTTATCSTSWLTGPTTTRCGGRSWSRIR